jgi:hypothetical protein
MTLPRSAPAAAASAFVQIAAIEPHQRTPWAASSILSWSGAALGPVLKPGACLTLRPVRSPQLEPGMVFEGRCLAEQLWRNRYGTEGPCSVTQLTMAMRYLCVCSRSVRTGIVDNDCGDGFGNSRQPPLSPALLAGLVEHWGVNTKMRLFATIRLASS